MHERSCQTGNDDDAVRFEKLFFNFTVENLQRCQPVSIRLMDNTQFRFGQALRPVENTFGNLLDTFKKTCLTCVHGFRLESLCVMTLLFEGGLFGYDFI